LSVAVVEAARRQGMAMALVAAAAYGTNIVSAQIAGQAGLSGPLLVFYRVFIMLALVGLALLIWRSSLAVPRSERRALLLFGVMSALVGSAYLSSVAFLPVTVAAVVFFTYPVLIVLAEPFVTRIPFRPERLLAACAAFIGVALVVGPDFHGLDPRGLVLALLASLGAATQFFAGAALPQTPLAARLFWSHLLILPVTALILAVTGGFQSPAAFALAPLAAAVTIGGYLIGFLLQVAAMTRISPGAAGLAFCAEPVCAVLIAAVVLGERLGPLQYLGCALVVATLVINVTLEHRRCPVAPA
jgi:drug/metabolite transporter (DMT)-like permease